MRICIVSTHPTLAEVLAEELREVRSRDARPVDARVIDVADVVSRGCSATEDDIVIVTEAAIDQWCHSRDVSHRSKARTEVIGALSSRWLGHESPGSRGFDGCVDFKTPARDIVRELHDLKRRGSVGHDEPTPTNDMVSGGNLCLDYLDRWILAFIAMGLADREISAKVHLSGQTVRNRVSRLLDRSLLQNRTQLAMACVNDPRLLEIHVAHPVANRLEVQIQQFGDLGIGVPVDDELQDLDVALVATMGTDESRDGGRAA